MTAPSNVKRITLNSALMAVNKGKSVPAVSLVDSDPKTAAAISKMVRSNAMVSGSTSRDRQAGASLHNGMMQSISDNSKQRATDNENIIKLFPDVELAIQILVSSVISPKDMVKTELHYKTDENKIFSAELSLKLQQTIKSHLNKTYKIEEELPDIIRDAMFEKGAHIKLIMPEAVVDELINQGSVAGLEAYKDIFNIANPQQEQVLSMGFLGNPADSSSFTGVGLEAYSLKQTDNYNPKLKKSDIAGLEDHVEIVDNWNLLKLPRIQQAAAKAKIQEITRPKRLSYGYGLEAAGNNLTEANKTKKINPNKLTVDQFTSIAYKAPTVGADVYLEVPTPRNAKRKSVGAPLVMSLPPESVIPVHVPGDPRNHIGYFVLIDRFGNPVTRDLNKDLQDYFASGIDNKAGAQTMASSLIEKARRNLLSSDHQPTLDQITEIYSSIVETEFVERLTSGLYNGGVEVAKTREFYRIMLARQLSAKFTRVLYVPKELVTYFAFKFFNNGVGRSYLDDVRSLTSIRAIILFSKVMARVKSSINNTNVHMTFDESDPDPMARAEEAMADVFKLRQSYFPLGINTPSDLVDWVTRQGLSFTFEGHPGLPNTKFDFTNQTLDHKVPDDELDEELRKQTYMHFGLSPETVDNGLGSNFATTSAEQSVLLSKRIMVLQSVLCYDVTDYAQKLTRNDIDLRKQIFDLMKENAVDLESCLEPEEKAKYASNKDLYLDSLVDTFIDLLILELPKPDVTSLATQTAAYNAYSEALEKALEAWISSDIVATDVAGQIGQSTDVIKNVLKAYFLRKWMADNGYMQELNDIVTVDEHGKAMLDIYEQNKSHLEGLIRSSLKFLQKMKVIQKAADSDVENLGTESTESSSDSSSTDEPLGEEGDEATDDAAFTDMGLEEDPAEPEDGSGGEEPATAEEPDAGGDTATEPAPE